MWVSPAIYRRVIPFWLPRAPYSVPVGGYSWRKVGAGDVGLSSIDDLRPAMESLLAFITGWSASVLMDVREFDLVGFSQGAAMAYTLALLILPASMLWRHFPVFFPEGVESTLVDRPVSGKSIFVSHGRQDDMVPVERLKGPRVLLKESGRVSRIANPTLVTGLAKTVCKRWKVSSRKINARLAVC